MCAEHESRSTREQLLLEVGRYDERAVIGRLGGGHHLAREDLDAVRMGRVDHDVVDALRRVVCAERRLRHVGEDCEVLLHDRYGVRFRQRVEVAGDKDGLAEIGQVDTHDLRRAVAENLLQREVRAGHDVILELHDLQATRVRRTGHQHLRDGQRLLLREDGQAVVAARPRNLLHEGTLHAAELRELGRLVNAAHAVGATVDLLDSHPVGIRRLDHLRALREMPQTALRQLERASESASDSDVEAHHRDLS